MVTAWILLAAYVLDRIIGDPRWLPHPVVGMGWLISRVEAGLCRWMEGWKQRGKTAARLTGSLLPLIVVGGVYAVAHFLLQGAAAVSAPLAWGMEVFLIAATIATKGLAEAARGIYQVLSAGDLAEARTRLSMIVGRDTDSLDEAEVVRGTVETVAENIVDAVTAPLFFAAVGGAPLALAYRAVNTLDSMVGYQDERYRHFGWASARLDDLANWLPARITLLSMLVVLGWRGYRPVKAWRVVRRDAGKHPSPNSGIAEAAMAGGLGIQLGGINRYRGVISRRARLGDPDVAKEPGHIVDAVRVLNGTTFLYVLALAGGVAFL
ncbi:adenosylcobinamide-phosphate synthase CbiB [Paludifilum halophilum]|uniref:Cobalamin biosynthesis protein CobD n=1 Tax=Paludifilum halophilum TaxID=1642702 RepID=A0A235B1S5_9BACL|nr:adenosylcobinamide-phosphate synthase CbiB [Paludifilum halophilum]OYD06181.1 cobalamin biosynthesis protein CobD [Paludifilum halophilum]